MEGQQEIAARMLDKPVDFFMVDGQRRGRDVFATGEHHDPPFAPSSPTTMLGYIAARTERLILSTATTLITTNDPVKIAEDYAMLQHLADGGLT